MDHLGHYGSVRCVLNTILSYNYQYLNLCLTMSYVQTYLLFMKRTMGLRSCRIDDDSTDDRTFFNPLRQLLKDCGGKSPL